MTRKIREHAVHLRHAALVEHRANPSIVGVHDVDPIAEFAERVPGRRYGSGIAIKSNQVRRARVEQRSPMSTKPHGAVDKHAAASGLQMLDNFRHHDRLVYLAHGSWLRA